MKQKREKNNNFYLYIIIKNILLNFLVFKSLNFYK